MLDRPVVGIVNTALLHYASGRFNRTSSRSEATYGTDSISTSGYPSDAQNAH